MAQINQNALNKQSILENPLYNDDITQMTNNIIDEFVKLVYNKMRHLFEYAIVTYIKRNKDDIASTIYTYITKHNVSQCKMNFTFIEDVWEYCFDRLNGLQYGLYQPTKTLCQKKAERKQRIFEEKELFLQEIIKLRNLKNKNKCKCVSYFSRCDYCYDLRYNNNNNNFILLSKNPWDIYTKKAVEKYNNSKSFGGPIRYDPKSSREARHIGGNQYLELKNFYEIDQKSYYLHYFDYINGVDDDKFDSYLESDNQPEPVSTFERVTLKDSRNRKINGSCSKRRNKRPQTDNHKHSKKFSKYDYTDFVISPLCK
jgi:hypothetical protein